MDCLETEVFGPAAWGTQRGMMAGTTSRMGTGTQATSGLANGSGLSSVPVNGGQFINRVNSTKVIYRRYNRDWDTVNDEGHRRVQERRDVGEG